MRVGELLVPVVGVMRRELLPGTCIQAELAPAAWEANHNQPAE